MNTVFPSRAFVLAAAAASVFATHALGAGLAVKQSNDLAPLAVEATRLSDILLRIGDVPSLQSGLDDIEKLIAGVERRYASVAAIHIDVSRNCHKADDQAAIYFDTVAKGVADLDARLKAGVTAVQASVEKATADAVALPPGIERFKRDQEAKQYSRQHRELVRLGVELNLHASSLDRMNKSFAAIKRSCPPSKYQTVLTKDVKKTDPSNASLANPPNPQSALNLLGSNPPSVPRARVRRLTLCLQALAQNRGFHFALRPGNDFSQSWPQNEVKVVAGEIGGKLCFDSKPFGPSECPTESPQERYRCSESEAVTIVR